MKKMIPISNLFLVFTTVYLKIIYGSFHSAIVKLYSIKDIDPVLRQGFVGINSQLSLLTIVVATLSVVISIACLSNKLCSRSIGIILLVLSSISFLFSLISI